MGRDAPAEPGTQGEYECFSCGYTTMELTYPGECPECRTAMRNRGTPLE